MSQDQNHCMFKYYFLTEIDGIKSLKGFFHPKIVLIYSSNAIPNAFILRQ